MYEAILNKFKENKIDRKNNFFDEINKNVLRKKIKYTRIIRNLEIKFSELEILGIKSSDEEK